MRGWGSSPHSEIPSVLVETFAMIPEAISFSGIAGVETRLGLFGALLLALTGRRGRMYRDDHL